MSLKNWFTLCENVKIVTDGKEELFPVPKKLIDELVKATQSDGNFWFEERKNIQDYIKYNSEYEMDRYSFYPPNYSVHPSNIDGTLKDIKLVYMVYHSKW